MSERIDTSTWTCEYVVVPVSALRVHKVEHEVVAWEASFCSEDAIPFNEGEALIDGMPIPHLGQER